MLLLLNIVDLPWKGYKSRGRGKAFVPPAKTGVGTKSGMPPISAPVGALIGVLREGKSLLILQHLQTLENVVRPSLFPKLFWQEVGRDVRPIFISQKTLSYEEGCVCCCSFCRL